jgi:hypothetical protein
MALLKSIETEYGVPAVYWNIGITHEDFKGVITMVTCYGYVSQEARFNGKQPISSKHLYIAGEEYIPDADRAALYAIIKQKPEFEGSENA